MTEPSNENDATRTSEPYRYKLSGQEFLDPALGSADGDAYFHARPASEWDPPLVSGPITNECSPPAAPLNSVDYLGRSEVVGFEALSDISVQPS